MNRQIGDRTVVLGAGMAGLLAARVLADSYGQVTVIDRDELPETPMHRRGVPHGRHLHALAARGQQALEELFPGSPRNWSLTGRQSEACWPTRACTSAATDFGRRIPDWRRVTGARVLRRADSSAEELLGAELVVDASGRGSRAPVWLEAFGCPRPAKDQVRIGLGYATRTYRLPADALDGDLAVLQAATPQRPRTGRSRGSKATGGC
jgi:threonine dehydrogenase-like Zn-dependent dehydrogenase